MGCGGGNRLLLGFRSGADGVFGGLFPGGLVLPRAFGCLVRVFRVFLVGSTLVELWDSLSLAFVGGVATSATRSWLVFVVWGISFAFFPSSPLAVCRGQLVVLIILFASNFLAFSSPFLRLLALRRGVNERKVSQTHFMPRVTFGQRCVSRVLVKNRAVLAGET